MSDNTANNMIFRKIPLTVNCGTLRQVYHDRPDETIWNREDLPHFCFSETVIFCFTFLDNALQPMCFQDDDLFELAADADYIHGDDPLMVFAGPEMVNIPGDWDDADPASGRISIRVNCNTAGFQQKIGSSENLTIRMDVKRISGDYRSVLFSDKAVAHNSVCTNENAPESAGPEYYTALQLDQMMERLTEEINEANALQDQAIGENTDAAATAQQTADEAKDNAATAQETADEAKDNAATAQQTADEAKENAATAQQTADEAKDNAATAQQTADEAKENAATAQETADGKISMPETGMSGQVLTLDADGITAVWATPAAGSGAWSVDDLQGRTIGTEYTADVDGWLILYVNSVPGGTCIPILINGITVSIVGNYNSNAGYPLGTMLPLYAGQTYKVDYSGYMGSWNVSYYFAPCGRA